MSNAFKKLWPYLLALAVLFGVAILTEDHLPFKLFPDNEEVVDVDTTSVTVDSVQVEQVMIEDTIQKEEVAEEVLEVGAIEGQKQWCLVVSSMPTQDLAEKYAEKVTDADAVVRFVEYLNTYRVVYGSYNDLRDAQSAYERVSAEYPNAWLVYF